MQVFICAAGKSSRMSKIAKGVPKPLLKINGSSILGYLLKIVSKHTKVEEIHLILGYKKELFKSAFGNKYKNVPIRYHFNPDFESTDNLFSLHCARNSMRDDIAFMTADLVIDPRLVYAFFDEEAGNKVLADPRKSVISKDVVKVKTENSRVIGISKKISQKNAKCAAVGIYRMDSKGKIHYFKAADRIFSSHGGDAWIIDPIPMLKNSCPFYVSNYSGYAWFDVDEPKDLERAKIESKKIYSSLA